MKGLEGSSEGIQRECSDLHFLQYQEGRNFVSLSREVSLKKCQGSEEVRDWRKLRKLRVNSPGLNL